MDIVEKLNDLHKQATTERSHYYVAACCNQAIGEITNLRIMIHRLIDDAHRMHMVGTGYRDQGQALLYAEAQALIDNKAE